MHGLCRPLREQGQYAEAERLQRDTLDVERRVLGSENPDTLASVAELAIILDNEARYPEAEKLAQEALDTDRRVLGVEDDQTQWAMIILASIFTDEGRLADAEKLYREALDIRRRVLDPINRTPSQSWMATQPPSPWNTTMTKQKRCCAKRSTSGGVYSGQTTVTPSCR